MGEMDNKLTVNVRWFILLEMAWMLGPQGGEAIPYQAVVIRESFP